MKTEPCLSAAMKTGPLLGMPLGRPEPAAVSKLMSTLTLCVCGCARVVCTLRMSRHRAQVGWCSADCVRKGGWGGVCVTLIFRFTILHLLYDLTSMLTPHNYENTLKTALAL